MCPIRAVIAAAVLLVCAGCQLPPGYVAHLNGQPLPASEGGAVQPTYR